MEAWSSISLAHFPVTATQSLAEVRRMQDDYLENLGQVVDQQLAIGATLQGALTEQTEQIDRL